MEEAASFAAEFIQPHARCRMQPDQLQSTAAPVLTKPVPDRLLKVREVAERFQVSTRTIWAWAAQSKLSRVVLSKGVVRFKESEVERLAAGGN